MMSIYWLFLGVYERKFGAAVREAERNRSAQSSFSYSSSYTGLQSTVNTLTHILHAYSHFQLVPTLMYSLCCCLSVPSAGYRRQYRRLLQCIVVIQKNYRALYWRRRFQMTRWATITLQKRLRGQRARRLCIQLLEEKRKREEEEEKRRREEQEAQER